MSWSDGPDRRRRALLAGAALAGCLALGGCFRPMLAEGTAADALRGQVALPSVGTRFGYEMNEVLERRLGEAPPQDAPWRLEIDTDLAERGLLVRQDNAVTRIQLTATARMRLYRAGESEPAVTGEFVSEAGFDETASLYASRVTRAEIEDRLARDLAERIARRVLARAGRTG